MVTNMYMTLSQYEDQQDAWAREEEEASRAVLENLVNSDEAIDVYANEVVIPNMPGLDEDSLVSQTYARSIVIQWADFMERGAYEKAKQSAGEKMHALLSKRLQHDIECYNG